LYDFGFLVECLQQHFLDFVDVDLFYFLVDIRDVSEQNGCRLGSSLLQSLQLFNVFIYFVVIPCELFHPLVFTHQQGVG